VAITWDEFLTQIQERGEYATGKEAERVARAVLATLGSHLEGDEPRELADQLPAPCASLLLDPLPATKPLSPREFVEAAATLIKGATPETARWDTGAVLSTLADHTDADLLRRILIRLPPGYALLFGRAELA
jgi:uncharacterized protein (DUF2267 family)